MITDEEFKKFQEMIAEMDTPQSLVFAASYDGHYMPVLMSDAIICAGLIDILKIRNDLIMTEVARRSTAEQCALEEKNRG